MHPLPSAVAPRAQGPPGRQPGRVSRGGPQAGPPHTDSSCLLTPPSTPLGLEPAVPDWPEPGGGTRGNSPLEWRRNGPSGSRGAALEGEAQPLAPPGSWAGPSGSLHRRGLVHTQPGLPVPATNAGSPGRQSERLQGPQEGAGPLGHTQPSVRGTKRVAPHRAEEGDPGDVCWASEKMQGPGIQGGGGGRPGALWGWRTRRQGECVWLCMGMCA